MFFDLGVSTKDLAYKTFVCVKFFLLGKFHAGVAEIGGMNGGSSFFEFCQKIF